MTARPSSMPYRTLNDTLSGSSASPPVKALIEKLQQRSTVRLLVSKEQDEQVTDRI